MALLAGPGDHLIGQKGDYTIQAQVAQGGMGAVFRALDARTGRLVAIKQACLDPAVCDKNRDEIRRQLTVEIDALLPVSHPNVPKIHERITTENSEFVVMELVEGVTLTHVQEERSRDGLLLEEARVLGWCLQILDALHYLHGPPHRIVHRDIKPDNLVLAPDGRVFLVDFGLMKQIASRLGESGPLIHAVGTVEFAPPEQYAESGSPTDQRSDLYSLGATLFYLLTGQLPPRAVERMLPVSINVALKLPSIRRLNATVSPTFESVITKAMALDPDERWQSAQAMREAVCPTHRFIRLPF